MITKEQKQRIRELLEDEHEDDFNTLVTEFGEVLLPSHLGIYIPEQFSRACKNWELEQDDISILEEGPDHPVYWEVWDSVIDNARLTVDGITYALFQDGDLFAIPFEIEEESHDTA